MEGFENLDIINDDLDMMSLLRGFIETGDLKSSLMFIKDSIGLVKKWEQYNKSKAQKERLEEQMNLKIQ